MLLQGLRESYPLTPNGRPRKSALANAYTVEDVERISRRAKDVAFHP